MTARPEWTYRLWTVAIILAAGCIYLLGDGRVNLWDRDEAWYAQSSRQMLQSGDWVIPHFLEKPRTAKPILIYWCQAASMKLLGDNELGARFPSAVAMVLTLGLLGLLLGRYVGAQRAMYTVLIFASSGLVIVTAKMCIIDSVQLLFITGAQVCLYAVYRAGVRARRGSLEMPVAARRGEACLALASSSVMASQAVSDCPGRAGHAPPLQSAEAPRERGGQCPAYIPALFWLCLGLAGLAKGPFALFITASGLVALAALEVGRQWKSWAAWKRAMAWWKLLRPQWGLPLALAVVLPWLITAYVRDPGFVRTLLGEAKRHTMTNQSGQWPMPGYFLAAIWVTYFPWCLLLPGSLVLAWKHRRTPQIRFALGLILGNWVIVDLIMTTKLPHYLLPAYAALAFLTATGLMRCIRSQYLETHKTGFFILAGVWAAGGAFMSNIPWVFFWRYQDARCAPAAAVFTNVGWIYVGLVLGFFAARRLRAAAVTMGLGMFVIVGVLYGLYFPRADFLRLPQRVAADLKERGLTQRGQVMMIGYREPSLEFYQGGTIRDEDDRSVLFNTSPETWPRWIVTTRGLYEDLGKAHPERQQLLEVISTHHGINYNTGCRAVDVLILRKRD